MLLLLSFHLKDLTKRYFTEAEEHALRIIFGFTYFDFFMALSRLLLTVSAFPPEALFSSE